METLHDSDFHGKTLGRPGTWVVSFLADWCPFCRRFLAEFEGAKTPGEATLAVADVTDEGSRLWDDFSIEVVPTLIVFRDGKAIFREDSDLGVGLPPGSLGRATDVAATPRKE